jgi:predicted CxxxxCH...CXXCH cytochrome family protein
MRTFSATCAFLALLSLTRCASSRDVEASSDCVSCHGDSSRLGPNYTLAYAAPPRDTLGNTVSARVGAHQPHVRGKAISDGVACSSCHPVPTSVGEHVNGVTAVVLRDPLGAPIGAYTPRSGAAAASCASTYCHGNFPGGAAGNKPSWTDVGTQSACTTCHAAPPPTGKHPSVFTSHAYMGTRCQFCHFDVATDGAITTGGRSLHVNGVVDVQPSNYAGTAAVGSYSKGSCSPGCHDEVGVTNPQLW